MTQKQTVYLVHVRDSLNREIAFLTEVQAFVEKSLETHDVENILYNATVSEKALSYFGAESFVRDYFYECGSQYLTAHNRVIG